MTSRINCYELLDGREIGVTKAGGVLDLGKSKTVEQRTRK
jgi:hypothetical protein